VDGTGMCGGCRVIVGGKSKFACVDGPEFDAHDIDFAVLATRNAMYRTAERLSLQEFDREPGLELAELREHCHVAELSPMAPPRTDVAR